MRESNFHTSILVVNILFNSLIIKALEALSQCFNQNKKKINRKLYITYGFLFGVINRFLTRDQKSLIQT